MYNAFGKTKKVRVGFNQLFGLSTLKYIEGFAAFLSSSSSQLRFFG